MSGPDPTDRCSAEAHATAYHEAGHAVAAYLLNRDVDYVAIGGRPGAAGRCGIRMEDPGSTSCPVERGHRAKAQAVILLAGGVAEWLATGTYDACGAEADLHRAVRLLQLLPADLERRLACADQVWDLTAVLLQQNWQTVRALAGELIRARWLTASQAHAIIVESLEGR